MTSTSSIRTEVYVCSRVFMIGPPSKTSTLITVNHTDVCKVPSERDRRSAAAQLAWSICSQRGGKTSVWVQDQMEEMQQKSSQHCDTPKKTEHSCRSMELLGYRERTYAIRDHLMVLLLIIMYCIERH